MHHILGNKVLEYDVDDRGVIVDEREYDRTVNPKPNIADWVKEHMVFWYDMSKPVDVYVPGVTYANPFVNGGEKLTYDLAGDNVNDVDCNIVVEEIPTKQSVPTNEILKANPYLQDFSGNNRRLKLNNFLFAAMSGVGGYDISSTNILPDRANVTVTDNRVIHITKKLSTTDNMVNIVPANSNPTHKFKVTGLSDGRQVSLVNRNGGFYTFDNGEHEVTLTYPEGTTSLYNAIGVTGDIGDMDVTIEFLPKYPNALVTDGVDDYGQVQNLQQGVKMLFYTCNNFRLSQILYDQRKVGYDKIQSSYFSIFTEANTIAYNARNVDGKTYIDGVLNETTIADNLLGKKTIITIVNSSANSERTGKPSFFSTYNNLGYFANLAFYNSIGFDSVPTKETDGFTEQDLIDYVLENLITK